EAAVFVHEFGHSFAGLGDEYYTSDVAYEDFYNLKVEPWEPNLTTLVNFEKKWGNMIDSNTPRPTPNTPEYKNKTGVFEGGGYMAKGIFRPCIDCRMKTNNAEGFCPVCTKAINDMIDFYTK
ncbi:MAG: peptidase M64, partial [Bacteroidales bacterium]|nr:peptidase M64 [Bacteroidales bacterium]